MKIKIKIMTKDVKTVAKIVLIDEQGRALMLKRSKDLKKHPDRWDLPGGHLKEGESLLKGLKREVKEETNLKIKKAALLHQDGETYFFVAKYDSQKIKLSHEHIAYSFISKDMLNKKDKYQKIVLKAMESNNDKY